eukprot:TRINITY_DN2097_c0_g1_i2.p1 TRINITY_DN2097_c0_g1~~TRINITY_DN2097_c0_g1_i2.p1  ORF type:complete len:284 (+),score=59.91 TRINITY_DN2097_c0_g1_i2:99-950(+)
MPIVNDSLATAASSQKWGDVEENDDIYDQNGVLDSNGIKTTVEYHINDKGQKVKTIRRVRPTKKIVRKNKNVDRRRKWRKFGECSGLPPGIEASTTSLGDEITLHLSLDNLEKAEKKTDSKEPVTLGIQCRICGKSGDHWTSRCPFKNSMPEPGASKSAPTAEETIIAAEGGTAKYVPPRLRGKTSGPGDSPSSDRRDEETTVRVTNLSEDTKESDLQELFRPFGPVSRIYLAKDKQSNLSRGFAFVNFAHKEDAAIAIEKLNGFGYDHLILHLEWARPSIPK